MQIKLPDITADTILMLKFRNAAAPTFLKVHMADDSAWTRGSVKIIDFYDGGLRGKIAMTVVGANTVYTTYVRKGRDGIYMIPPMEGFKVATVEVIDTLIADYNKLLIEAQTRVQYFEELRSLIK